MQASCSNKKLRLGVGMRPLSRHSIVCLTQDEINQLAKATAAAVVRKQLPKQLYQIRSAGAAAASRMEDGEYEHSESRDKIITIYSDFMTRITQFEELVSLGSRLLLGFQQALGFLGRPEINKTSTLVERIINAHGSRRVLSYIEAGCVNSHDSLQNMRKLNTCHLGLLDYVNKATVVMDELQSLLDDAAFVVRTAQEKVEDASFGSDSVISSDEEEEPSSDLSKPRVEDYAATMAIIFSMVKQDYTMQVKIASSLNHKSSQGEMETYCQMWSLRPFVDDEIMLSAWALVCKP